MLDAEVDREPHRQARVERAATLGIGVEPFVDETLHARRAAVVHVHGAEHVPAEPFERVGPAQLGAEGEPRQAEIVHLLGEPRGKAAPDPREAAVAVGEDTSQLRPVEIGKHGLQPLAEMVDAANERRVRIEGRHLDVGREQTSAAIDDIRPREAAGCLLGQRRDHIAAAARGQAGELERDARERHHDGKHDETRPHARGCRGARIRRGRRKIPRPRLSATPCRALHVRPQMQP